jgi:hypothetical protein
VSLTAEEGPMGRAVAKILGLCPGNRVPTTCLAPLFRCSLECLFSFFTTPGFSDFQFSSGCHVPLPSSAWSTVLAGVDTFTACFILLFTIRPLLRPRPKMRVGQKARRKVRISRRSFGRFYGRGQVHLGPCGGRRTVSCSSCAVLPPLE